MRFELSSVKEGALVATGRTYALRREFVKGRDNGVSIAQKLLPGWTKRRILIEFASADHVVDLLLEVSDLRDRVAELALIERQRNAVELTQKAGTILCFG